MSSSAQNGGRSPNLMSQSMPTFVTDDTDNLANAGLKISQVNGASRERSLEPKPSNHDDVDHERFLVSRSYTGRSYSDLDGSRVQRSHLLWDLRR